MGANDAVRLKYGGKKRKEKWSNQLIVLLLEGNRYLAAVQHDASQ